MTGPARVWVSLMPTDSARCTGMAFDSPAPDGSSFEAVEYVRADLLAQEVQRLRELGRGNNPFIDWRYSDASNA
jgi:hypothetical protein